MRYSSKSGMILIKLSYCNPPYRYLSMESISGISAVAVIPTVDLRLKSHISVKQSQHFSSISRSATVSRIPYFLLFLYFKVPFLFFNLIPLI